MDKTQTPPGRDGPWPTTSNVKGHKAKIVSPKIVVNDAIKFLLNHLKTRKN